jgi:4-alpha-glucanotransferase
MSSTTSSQGMQRRTSGILLHPTSLPGRFGIGDLGGCARRFADFLASAGQRLWQVLPLGPTGYGDSPYQGLGVFAGNPLLVSLEQLLEGGYLEAGELLAPPAFPEGLVDYGRLIPWKSRLLRIAGERFHARAGAGERQSFSAFCEEHASWLEDFGLFLALKERHGGRPWPQWDAALAFRDPGALEAARRACAAEIRGHCFCQFVFDRQWSQLRAHCRVRGIRIMGDLPIYVAHDSAEVWAHRELFHLDRRGEPERVAGVPPDYFSATGQLWGNPLYRWAESQRTGHAFWIARARAALRTFDLVRLDHFRGFEAYWEVEAGEPTAVRGRWLPGPGPGFFEALEGALGKLPFVAENLGVITPAVEALRRRFGFPGMSILQFAFGDDPQAPSFLPHNYQRDLVAYTGTHDNDTVLGWWSSEGTHDSTRTPEAVRAERALAEAYLDTDGSEMNWVFIRAVLASVADTAIIPLQDVLGLGSEARMNRPSTARGNWRWRYREPMLTEAVAERLRHLTALYGRAS